MGRRSSKSIGRFKEVGYLEEFNGIAAEKAKDYVLNMHTSEGTVIIPGMIY